MAWAAHRRTTLVEDEAYCLLGLFNVNMPLLYGEGSRAFRRLQEEIQKAHSSAILGTLGTGGMRLLVARSDPLEIKNVLTGECTRPHHSLIIRGAKVALGKIED